MQRLNNFKASSGTQQCELWLEKISHVNRQYLRRAEHRLVRSEIRRNGGKALQISFRGDYFFGATVRKIESSWMSRRYHQLTPGSF